MVLKFIYTRQASLFTEPRCAERSVSSRLFDIIRKKIISGRKLPPVFLLLIFFLSFCQSERQERNSNDTTLPVIAASQVPERIDSLQQTCIELEIEELFWRNRVSMSRDPSIDLAIDLIDSTVCLDIKGVTLRKARISKYQISRSMVYLKWYLAYKSWLAGPFNLKQDSVSSIPKEPVFIKDLATYPLEYFDDWTYFTRLEKEGPVHFLLEYDRGLLVQVDQDSDTVQVNELPEHWFRISIPATDAKAIYRALALPSELSLRY